MKNTSFEFDASRRAGERVLSDVRALSRDAEALLAVTAHDVSDNAREARARMMAALGKAQATCAEFQDEAISRAKSAVDRGDTAVRAHPYEAIGAAFGVGLLLGFIFGRK